MNSKTTKTSILAATILSVLGVLPVSHAQSTESYAEVLHVEDIKEMVDGSREICEDTTTTEKAQPKDKKKIAGTVLGAVVGGVLGRQIGGGSGKKLATIAGVAAGGVAGNKVQGSAQSKKTTTKTEQNCRIETGPIETVTGYNVTYKLDGKASTMRTNFKPKSDRIPVKDGKLVFQH